MKKYYLDSNKANVVLSMLDKTGFRTQLANEIFNCVMNCIEGNIDYSEFAEPLDFNAEFYAITNQPFISDLENCKSQFSKISDRKFYVNITQRFADIVNSKKGITKLFVPHDFIVTQKDDLMKLIRKYYYLKSLQKNHLSNEVHVEEVAQPKQITYVAIYNDFSDHSTKNFYYNNNQYFDKRVHNNNHQTTQNVIFKNEMTIETYRHLNVENIIIEIRKKHLGFKLDIAEKHSAWIIDYFIFKNDKFSKRKNLLEEYYGLSYDQFRREHQWPIIDRKGKLHLEVSDLERAIVYVDKKVEKKYLPEVFTSKLVEEMVGFYELICK